VYGAMKLDLRAARYTARPLGCDNRRSRRRGLNQIWALDCKADTLYGGGSFRTRNMIGEGTREVLGIDVATSIPSLRVFRSWNSWSR